VLFSEGIEHLDAQISALEEMARVLRPGGVLVVTTPNLLNLSARLNFMLTGHAHGRRAAAVSAAQYWGGTGAEDDEIYFGHVFLINAYQLRFYLEHAGFQLVAVDTARYSLNSLLLAPILYPAVWVATRRFLSRAKSKLSQEMRQTYLDQVLSPAVLFGKKLIVTAQKQQKGQRPKALVVS
jgi:SAM-dependent methyltransferase